MKRLYLSLCLLIFLFSAIASGQNIGISLPVPVSLTVNPTLTIPLNQGWNLMSFSLVVQDTSIESILDGIMDSVIIVNGFEAGPGIDSGAKTYDPELPEFSDLGDMDHLHGYWIKLTEPEELNVTGAVPEDRTISLLTNWNLISYLCDETMDVEDVFADIMDKVIIIKGFDNGGKTYNPDLPMFSDLQEMKPGFGYWVKMSESAELDYSEIC